MPPSQNSLRQGRILFAWIKDRNGHGKLRPAVVVSNNDEISPDEEFAVISITTTFPDPPPQFCVPIPWHPRGHPITKLHQRSAAIVNWLSLIRPADVVGYGGDVPHKTMRLILAKMDELPG